MNIRHKRRNQSPKNFYELLRLTLKKYSPIPLCANTQGFTVVETIIFLGVTGVLFGSVILVVSGQQAKTDFSLAVTEIRANLQDVANDVNSGFYNYAGDIKCVASGSSPSLSFGSGIQGTNQDCIFIGRAMQFDGIPATSAGDQFWVYNIVGNRLTSTKTEVTTYAEAKPTAIAPGAVSNPSLSYQAVQKNVLRAGLKPVKIQSIKSSGVTNISGFAFMSTLGSYNAAGNLSPGASHIDIIPISNGTVDPSAFADDISNLASVTNLATIANPDGGFRMCFDSAAGNQHAIITFGTEGSLTPRAEIESGPTAIDALGKCV